jgi:hypothetical protein
MHLWGDGGGGGWRIRCIMLIGTLEPSWRQTLRLPPPRIEPGSPASQHINLLAVGRKWHSWNAKVWNRVKKTKKKKQKKNYQDSLHQLLRSCHLRAQECPGPPPPHSPLKSIPPYEIYYTGAHKNHRSINSYMQFKRHFLPIKTNSSIFKNWTQVKLLWCMSQNWIHNLQQNLIYNLQHNWIHTCSTI